MNKFYLSIAVLCASLCAGGACAQEPVRRVFTLDEIKSFRSQFRGVKDKAFFLFRLAKIYA